MKKFLLIAALSIFGVSAVVTAPPSGSIVFAQKKEKDKKDPPGPPVIKEKGPRDKPKEPPPKKDKRPS